MNLAIYGRRAGKIDIVAFAIVDEDTPDLVFQTRWHFGSQGYITATDYREGHRRQTLRLHRVVMGLEYGDPQTVDHVNGDPSDNRRENLRIISRDENAQNVKSRPGSSSRHRGVSFNKDQKKWHAYCRVNGRLHHFGFYRTEKEAAEIAAEKRAELLPFSVDGR